MSSSSFSSLIDLLSDRAQKQPHNQAFTFLKDGEIESDRLTYQDLDRQARAIAASLESVTSVGDRVLLVYPFNACLEFIAALFGCFYAGAIAIPTRPPQNSEEWGDFGFRVRECQVSVALTSAALIDKLQDSWLEWLAQSLVPQESKNLPWIATDRILWDGGSNWQERKIDRDAIAYFQYTSGSTGIPKAVAISHDNVLQNCANFQQTFPTLDFRGVNWLPLTHDMGLVAGIMQTLYAGACTALMSPVAVFQNPSRWLKAISTHKATISGGPNFVYDLCVQRVKPEQITDLDLSSWEIAGNGAEPVRPETLERFTALFAPYGFRREAFYLSYGMAEATLVISGGAVKESSAIQFVDEQALEQNRVVTVAKGQTGARTVISCGRAWPGNQVIIVNPKTLAPCPSDGVGEIWVQGPGLSRNYWHRPQETEQTFQAYLSDSGKGPFLRTGDLGFIHNDQLFITGRLKDMMIFWGRNFYPQLLEQTSEKSHPALSANASAAFSVDVEGEERLVIAQEIDRHALRKLNSQQIADIIAAIRQTIVMQHLVEVYAIALLKPGTVPKTSSGKVQRRRCRDRFLAGTLAVVEQWFCSVSERLDPTDLTSLPGIEEA
ncbi:fatty acyl-AMP ligase [Dendronalium sp. ChiSLP03b]|uniref:fatty acyl-AMP ligase n=1 Tax=Dendronalium sp. ChiSLP03b TaxID=3075381 RepID=UPI002AD495E3|nr:fatty acyl-AMP ligase [Dendronalium sp. ChiSLP03b]MDZ8205898.1 fatty acyl-AMP ligase [Dendronalium sp. ChiSLP03b]